MSAEVAAPRARLRLPDRCASCDAVGPRRGYRLDVGKRARPVVVPLCERCSELAVLKQIAWVVGALAVAGASVALGGLAVEALLRPELARAAAGPAAIALIAMGAAIVWLALRRRRAAFHRRFSAIWLTASTADEITLGVRSAGLAGRIAALSGVPGASPPETETERERDAARPLEPAHHGRAGLMSSHAIVLLVGLAVVLVGLVEFAMLGADERHGRVIRRVWLEIVIYRAGGRAAVLALFVIAGGVLIAIGGRGLWRKLRAR